MTTPELMIAIYLALVPPALGALFWARFNRLEARMDALEAGLRTEFRQEIASLRHEMRQDSLATRADLTQVALAVGAGPQASEA